MKQIKPIVPEDEQPLEASQEKIEELAETAEEQLKKKPVKSIPVKSFDEDSSAVIEVGSKIVETDGTIEDPEPKDEPAGPLDTDLEKEAEDGTESLDTEDGTKTELNAAQEEVVELDEDGIPVNDPTVTDAATSEDTELDSTVDDIVRQESDDLLDSEDKELAAAFEPEKKRSPTQKLKDFIKAWVTNPRARWTTLITVFVLGALIAIIPAGRYFALNMVGIRSKASLRILDNRTQQPLRNVRISLAGQEAKTDKEGRVSFQELRLGPTELKIEKRAFAPINKKITIGWGSNPLGEYRITATGTLYNISVKDWLSNKPLEKVEARSGEASALSDSAGRIVLAVDTDAATVKINLEFEGYRTESVTITENDKTQQTIAMVPAKKHLFVSKRSGKFDIYKIDADGKNERLLLAGSGLEREDMTILQQHDGTVAALVATRENTRNKDGFLLSGLYSIDIESGQLQKIGRSERVQLIGWLGDRLVYVMVSEGVSNSNPRRHKLVSYNYKEGTTKELAYANYFNDVLIAGTKIYYAPSNAFLDNNAEARLFSIDADGSNKQTVLSKETWNVFRTAYDTLSISTASKEWFTYRLGNSTASRSQSAPPQLKTRVYIDNADRSKALWIDERDGKGVILEYSIKTHNDRIVVQEVGLNYPAYWLSKDYIVYRVSGSSESADYVVSTQGGQAKKIRDVSKTGGVDSWYFYQ